MDLLWARAYSERASVSTSYPGIYGMTTDRLGNTYFVRNDRMSPLNGYRQITVSKLDPDGFLSWITPITEDTIYYTPAHYYDCIQVDSVGNVYVVENGGHLGVQNRFSRISKISPNGSKLWTQYVYQHTANADLPIERIKIDGQGNTFLMYLTHGSVNPYHYQCHVLKMDSSGVILSDTTMFQTGSRYLPFYLLELSQGGFLAVCGNVLPFTITANTIVAKINRDGSISWSLYENKQYYYVTLDDEDNIYALYQPDSIYITRVCKKDSIGNTVFDILSPVQYADLIVADDAGNSYLFWDNGDIEVTKLDTLGQVMWRRAYTPPLQAYETPLKATFHNGHIYMLGVQKNVVGVPGGPHRAMAVRMDTAGQVLGAYFHPLAPDLAFDEGAFLEVGQDGSMTMAIGAADQTSHLIKTCGFECGYNIEGNIIYDADGDCNVTQGQAGFQNAIIGIDGGQAYTMTDVNGNYRLRRDSGLIDIAPILPITYLNACQPNAYQFNVTPQNYFHNGLDFVVVGNPFIDAAVSMESTPPRVANFQDIDVQIDNLGTLPITPLLELELDPRVTIVPSGSNHDSIVGNRLFRQLTTIAPFSTLSQSFDVLVDTLIPLGEVCTHYAYLHDVGPDVDSTNNQDSTEWFFLTSYDPNDKSVSPSGVGIDGEIDFDSLQTLTYRIRFQNTGNAVAYNVMVRDTLSPLLDLSTFQMGVASHNYRLELTDNRILTWSFDNIYLPDSTTDLAGSNGYLKFRIKPLQGLPLGTQLANKAAIYFDYNLPIITNTALLTYALPLVAAGAPTLTSALEVFPNPAQGRVTLRLRDARTPLLRVQVCDLRGAVLLDQPVRLQAGEASLDISALPPGIYLVQASQGAARHVQRLLVW